MKLLKTAGLAALLLAGIPTLSMATTVGLPYTSGDYATWDTFSGPTFSNANPGISNGDRFSSALTSTGGGLLTGSGDRIYGGAMADDASFSFTINVNAHYAIDTFSLALKFSHPNPDAIPALDYTDFFTSITLNGDGATPVFLGGTGEITNGQEMGVVQWTWTDLSFFNGDSFSVNIFSPARTGDAAAHVSVDAVSVTAVPEPSTYALLALGAVVAVMTFRRRQRTA